jgi:nitronate monooxygenase
MLATPLCDELGIRYPIFNVGFARGALAELAAAVSNAGGCGVIGAGPIPAEHLRGDIRRVRSLTEHPFGANVIIAGMAFPEAAPLVEERIAVCLEERVPVLVLFWGDPEPFVADARRAGTKLFLQAGSVEEAQAAAAAGVDAVIAQGSEAGGHVRSRTSIWEILPACVEAVAPVPVLASGGIGDGSGIARALSVGAQGVSLGTAFVASEEANILLEYKRRVVESSAEDTVYTEELFDVGWSDAPHRTLRGRTFDEWDAAGRPPSGGRPGEGTIIGTLDEGAGPRDVVRYSPLMGTPGFTGEVDYLPMWAGTSVDSVQAIEPAAEIVRRLVREAESSLRR